MISYFVNKLTELRMSAHEFFQMAYLWKFGQHRDLHDDHAQWLLHGILPKYCVEYIKDLQKKEGVTNAG